MTTIDELLTTGNDMKNLLNSTDIARSFSTTDCTYGASPASGYHPIQVIPGDTERSFGRHFERDYPESQNDVLEMLRTRVFPAAAP